MNRLLLLLLITPMSHGAAETLLAVFAHPDDESTVAPILARYAREGIDVHVAIATDGRLGTREHAGVAAGDDLAAVRREEMKCAAAALGANLVHFGYHDQLRAGEGYGGHIPHVRALLKDVADLVERLQPDAIITWGPDGGSNHMDHRLVGDTVTGVYLSRDWGKPVSLYFFGTPASRIEDAEERQRRGVHDEYLNVTVKYSAEDYKAAEASLRCHRSQYTAEEFDAMISDDAGQDSIRLREFVAPGTKRHSLFGSRP
ncbi:MAG: PIG-L family deacetylase [Gammaproteobacteria bacterium]|nr:PIG-L family deacetylase [Gammaproteobacteria bacterium]